MNLDRMKQFFSRFSIVHSNTDELLVEGTDRILSTVPNIPSQEEKNHQNGNNQFKENKKPIQRNTMDNRPVMTAMITEDVVIEGSITAGSNLMVAGTVNGNVTCHGDIDIRGRITGDIKGDNINISQAEIAGDVSAGDLLVVLGGTVNGSLTARTAEIDGVINGNLTITETLSIKQNAVIKGDITAASLSMSQNAAAQGKISIGKI